MTRFKLLLAAAAFSTVAFAGNASAMTYVCGPAIGACSFDGETGGYSNIKRAPTVAASDTFSILFASAGEAVLTFTTAKLVFTNVLFNGFSFTPVGGVDYIFNIATAGSYDLIVSATNPSTTVTSSYSGTIDFVAAPSVPEPATWALMLGGLALVGSSMRRRQTAVSFV